VDLKQPQDVEEEMLVEDMYRGNLMQKRYHRAMDCALVRQTEMNIHRWEEERQNTVAALKQTMRTAPAEDLEAILDELRTFGHGVLALIGDFEDLSAALENSGFWNPERLRTGVLLLGAPFGPAAVAERAEVYRLVLFNFLCMPERLRPPGEVERMLRPENRPVELRDLPREALLVPVEEARSALQEWVDEALQELNESLESVIRDVDERERARVTDPAAIVMDPEKLRRFKQIGSEYRALYYRAASTLRTVRKEQGPEKKPPKRTDPTDAHASTDTKEPADRRATVTEPPSVSAPPPAAAATATDMKINPMVGKSAGGGETAPSGESEVASGQRVVECDPRAEANSGNEPSSMPAECPGPQPLARWESVAEATLRASAPPNADTTEQGVGDAQAGTPPSATSPMSNPGALGESELAAFCL
jgi:hypothetical protein